jgi:hypothetical protein
VETQNVEFLMKLLDEQAEKIKQQAIEIELLKKKLADRGVFVP